MTYSDDELRALWRAAGGSFHGPVVETGDMPESKLLPFLRDLISGKGLAPDPDAELRRKLIEQTAQVIYGTWCGQRGFVPWLVGGNSTMQDKARQLASTHRPAVGTKTSHFNPVRGRGQRPHTGHAAQQIVQRTSG